MKIIQKIKTTQRAVRQATFAVVLGIGMSCCVPSAQAAWTPADLPNLALWLDGSDTNTITLNAGKVSRWNDKSGNSRHVAQANTDKQPVYANNILNGLPALSFDGSNDSLFTNAATITLNQPVHRFIVCKFLTKTYNSVVFDSDTQAAAFFFYNGEIPGGKWVWNGGSYGTSDVTSNHIHYNLANNTASYYSTDGATPSGPVTAGTNTLQGVRIGGLRAEFVNGYAFQGYVYEVLLVQGTLSDTDRQKTEGYLAWKWGMQASLPADHPYKSESPSAGLQVTVTAPTAGQTFPVGSSISATVSVANGTAPYSVTYYTNSASAWSTNNASTNLFTIPLGTLAAGTYTNYAMVTDNASATAYSATNTFTVAPYLTYATTNLNEATANDGSVAGSIVITLAGDTFSADVVSAGRVTVANVPAGLTTNIVRDSDTQITLSFGANATSHAASNTVTDLTVAFDDDAFTASTAAQVTGSTNSSLRITFRNPGALSYSPTRLTEVGDNDGSVPGSIVITLTNDTFTADAVSGGYVTAANVPAGLTTNFVRNSDTQITLSFGANASPHDAGASVANLTVAFADGALTSGNAAAVTGSTRNDLRITFYTTGGYADALRAYWTFDALTDVAPAGLTWAADYFADQSGNGRNAVVMREGVDANFSNLTPYTTSGKFGNAFRSEKGNDYYSDTHYYTEVATQAVDNLNFYGNESFTFSFWTYVNYPLKDTWQRGYYFTKHTGGSWDLGNPARGYGFMREGGAAAERLFWRVNSSNNLQSLTVPANGTDRWDAGMWAYWTIVRNHATGRVDVYVNGVSRVNGTQNTTLNDDWVTSTPFRIASRNGETSRSFVWPCAANADGFIDDFAVFGKAMTATEAKAAYSLGNHADLKYPMSNVIQLLDLHLAGSGSVILAHPTYTRLTWTYASGLSGTAGDVQVTGVGKFTVVLDGTAGTGVTGTAPPNGTLISFF